MRNRFILTPYFLDQHLPGLIPLVDRDWLLNDRPLPEGSQQIRMAAIYERLAEIVGTAMKSGERPVSIAGDCCTSIGMLAGLQQADISPSLIWFDAHGDFNTWETTPSGFLGGMPLAMLVGRGEQTIMERAGTKVLPENQVILSDARDLDPGEQEILADSQVTHLLAVQEFFDHPLPGGPVWVHFDTDLIDSRQAPAMNYPVPGGPSLEDLHSLFRFLAGTGQVVGVSFSSWNPDLDRDGQTSRVCMDLLMELVQDKSGDPTASSDS